MDRREFFDRAAADWDRMIEPGTEETLRDLVSRMPVEKGARVLDVGTGTGVMVPLLLERVGETGEIVGLDFSPKMLEAARGKGFPPNVQFVEANVVELPYPDSSFDLVVCNALLPHLPDKARTLSEMNRVLVPGGALAICHASSRRRVNRMHQEIGGAVANDRVPEEAELRALLAEAGFANVEIHDEERCYLATALKPLR